jgi:hypothetical protein
MAEPHPFRRAAEAKDVELHSPVLFRGFEGREAASMILTHVAATLENLTYVDEAVGEDNTVVLRFKANVGDLELEGIDYLTLDEDGRVADITVFMRPMRALTAFNTQMAERLGIEIPSN